MNNKTAALYFKVSSCLIWLLADFYFLLLTSVVIYWHVGTVAQTTVKNLFMPFLFSITRFRKTQRKQRQRWFSLSKWSIGLKQWLQITLFKVLSEQWNDKNSFSYCFLQCISEKASVCVTTGCLCYTTRWEENIISTPESPINTCKKLMEAQIHGSLFPSCCWCSSSLWYSPLIGDISLQTWWHFIWWWNWWDDENVAFYML